MKTFLIEFVHTVELTYTAKIEAESREDALAIFDDAPFDHLVEDSPSDEQGLDIKIIDVTAL